MNDGLICRGDLRRQHVRDSGLNGIDFIEVLCPDQVSLCVHLFSRNLPEDSPKVRLRRSGSIGPANVRIEGGTRIRDIRVRSVEIKSRNDPELEDCLRIELDRAGDFSTYTLRLVAAENGKPTDRALDGFDPRYAEAEFSFKVCCNSDLDCKQTSACPPERLDEPGIDYLAKDYASFRQLILDRLALVMPDWKESHIPDFGLALVEVLAYTGDYLSYYQDAVATEAYVGQARQRISVKRHVRLMDYAMHEGCNARAYICFEIPPDPKDTIPHTDPIKLDPAELFFITDCPKLSGTRGAILHVDDLADIPVSDYEVFEPVSAGTDPFRVYPALMKIPFYTWGNRECCLPRGALRATLKDDFIEQPSTDTTSAEKSDTAGEGTKSAAKPAQRKLDSLKAGDILIFEEVLGPGTGNVADADPKHRQAVRLTHIDQEVDPLFDQPVLLIEWAPEDALAFPLCISARLPAPDCTLVEEVSVARGNVLLVDHGRKVESEDLGTVWATSSEGRCDCQGMTDVLYLTENYRPVLQVKPVTFRQTPDLSLPASAMLVQDPRFALPQVHLSGVVMASGKPATSEAPRWSPRLDLLDSGEQDPVFTVEINNEGCACLRFGDGEQGQKPEACMSFTAAYRTGNGPSGNVGAETIRHLVLRQTHMSGTRLESRNPLPATGGTSAEPVEEVRLVAPYAYRKKLERAITGGDYAEIAGRNRHVQKAECALRWSGSWYEAQVAVDPLGTEDPQPDLYQVIEGELEPFRRIGHDVAVTPADYVPLALTLSVCVRSDYLLGYVKAALRDRFSNLVLPDGSSGFFHPDNLTFGSGIPVTSIIAAAQAVPGVRCVRARIKRLDADDRNAIDDGILNLGLMEIGRLANDPSFPEHGTLTLALEGGR
jgi:hypothetical protein